MRIPIRKPARQLLWGLLIGVQMGCSSSVRIRSIDAETIVRRYFEGWANQADIRVADELIAPDLVLRNPPSVVTSREAYKQGMLGFHEAFPDLHFNIEDLLTQGNKVLVRWTLSGTQKGEIQGHPPTDRRMQIAGMSQFRIENGRIREIWVSMDRLGMQQQLGWLPPPPSAPR